MSKNDSQLDRKLLVSPETSVSEAMSALDAAAEGFLLVVNEEGRLIGSLNDGDIRRYILKTGGIKGKVKDCTNFSPICVQDNTGIGAIKQLMIDKQIKYVPIIDAHNRIIEIVTWSKVFKSARKKVYDELNVPVVIMAGGKGSRLEPFTKILPKPLIPIGEKPVIQIIMDKFHSQGVSNFHLILNYKGNLIKSYLESNNKSDYNINFIWEDSYLGTAGGLKYLPENISEPFIISNCDITVETDFHELVDYHLSNGNDLSIVGSFVKHKLPYGVLHFQENGDLNEIAEKPEYDFTINTGIYVLKRNCLNYIPPNREYHITDLVSDLLKKGRKVGVFPVSEKSFIDIGQWEEYRKNVSFFDNSKEDFKSL
ncbi:MAG: nucleotidyltransferase family protein [Oligoflexales bacterium]